MAQVTWRVSDDLADRVRRAAERQGWSVNEYLSRVLDAATDPDLAGDEAERVRERLDQAGLLVPRERHHERPDHDAVARARARAGHGTRLADLVERDRG